MTEAQVIRIEREALGLALNEGPSVLAAHGLRSYHFTEMRGRLFHLLTVAAKDADNGIPPITRICELAGNEMDSEIPAGELGMWLAELSINAGVNGHEEYYAREIKEAWVMRETVRLAMEIAKAAGEGNAVVVDALRGKLEAVRSKADPKDDGLPALLYGDQLEASEPVLPGELVAGLLHRGAKMILGGGSKSFKTWCLLDLAISISQGIPWWGRTTTQGVVVYLNFEVQGGWFHDRCHKVRKAKGVVLDKNLIVWNLRGHATDHSTLLPQLEKRLQALGIPIAAIFLDPAYKIMSGSEKEQENVAALMNSIERMGERLGCATIFGAHFAKGDQSMKEAIDRISGSGVFARDPDAILPMTRHEEDDVFVIEPILRNCPPVAPFCIRWEFPLMKADESDPKQVRSSKPGGNKPKFTVEDIIKILPQRPVLRSEWVKLGADELGAGKTAMYDLIALAQKTKKIEFRDGMFIKQAIFYKDMVAKHF